MKTHRRFILFVLVAFLAGVAEAANITSRQSGPWSDPFTWDVAGVLVPTSNDDVTVVGSTVTVNITTAAAKSVTINSGGKLLFSRSVSSQLTLSSGNVTVNFGGILDMGAEVSPIPPGVTATLVLARGNGATRHRLDVPSPAFGGGGRFTSRGADKDPVAVALGPGANLQGRTDLQVPAADAEGWSVGDTITIGATELTGVPPNPWENQTERRVIVSTSVVGSTMTVAWAPGACTVSNGISVGGDLCYTHTVAYGVRVANLTRNVVVRSSGTNTSQDAATILVEGAASPAFQAVQTEFFALGVNGSSVGGLDLNGNSVLGAISSCTFHGGHNALRVNSDAGVPVVRNVFFDNTGNLDLETADNLAFQGNEVVASGGVLMSGSNLLVRGNAAYSNGFSPGISISYSNVLVEGNRLYANGLNGLWLNGVTDSHVSSNTVFHNTLVGMQLYFGADIVLSGNDVWENRQGGISLWGVTDPFLANNVTRSNFGVGISLNGVAVRPVVASHLSYSNSSGAGVEVGNAQDVLLQDSRLGYDASGVPAANSGRAVSFGNAPFSGSARGCATNDVESMQAGTTPKGFLFYNHDFATGTVLLRGEYTVPAGASFSLDNAQLLYPSAATAARLVRGAGHALTVTATDDATAVSQVIVVKYEGGQWTVTGSSTGAMGSPFIGSQSGLSFGQFTMDFIQGSPQEGDRLVFGLLASSRDAGVQKRLFMNTMGPSPTSGIQPRLMVAPLGSFVLRGDALAPATMSRSVSTYTFVSSGSVTLENARVTNTDASGLQLTGSGGVTMSSATFDDIGVAGGAYITAGDLTSNATFYSVAFDTGTADANAPFSVRVQGTDAGLRWYMAGFSGNRAGDTKDSDPNQKILWDDVLGPDAPGSFTATPGAIIGEVRLDWTAPWDRETDNSTSTLKGGSFRIYRSTDPAQTALAGPQSAGAIVLSTTAVKDSDHVYSDTGLISGATYYYRMWAADEFGNPSSTMTAQAVPWGDLVTPTVSLSAGGAAQGAGAALGVSTGAAVTLTFNKSMSPVTVFGSVRMTQLKDNLGVAFSSAVAVSVSSNAAGTVYTVTPPALSGNSTYEVVVGTEAGDAFGNYLASPISLRFTTLMDRTVRNVVTEGTGGAVADIPAFALAADGYIRDAVSPAGAVAATQKLIANTGDALRFPVPGGTAGLELLDAWGAPQPPAAPVTVSLPYDDDGPRDGIVDGTNVRVDTLAVHWLDEAHNLWVRLPSAVDPVLGRVSAQTSRFAVFAGIGQASAALSQARAFPVPWRPVSGDLTFTDVGQSGVIEIFTPDGALVREIPIGVSGQESWNGKNADGGPVATGVYFFRVSGGGSEKRGKLVVIR